jgi:hemoglobin-like flavoprotein
MTPEQVFLVQRSWRQVLPIADTAAELFYTKLFSLDPAVKPLFKGDMKAQGKKLMAMIGAAVNGLTQLETMVSAVKELGRRHVKYGVKDSHYDSVGSALLWTLEQGLGDAFTPDVKAAWTTVYGVLSTTMKDAAKVPA